MADSPLLEVWKLLRDPVLAFYQDGMNKKKIEGFLNVINDSCQAKKHWYIPFSKGSQEIQELQEEQHTAFCTWLLGRLFYILGRESLLDIHLSCIAAQLKILEVCSENECMTRLFFLEYTSCLIDLLAMQTSEGFFSNGQQRHLKRFTPVPSKALESLNLTPQYILVKSESLVINLEKYLVEILNFILPHIVLSFEDLVGSLWNVMCQLMQVAPPHLKLSVVKTFSKIVSAGSCNNRTALADLCHSLKTITLSSVQITLKLSLVGHETVGKQDLNSGVVHLIDALVSSQRCKNDTSNIKVLLEILLIVMRDLEPGPSLKTACCNASKLVDILPHDSVNPDSFCFLLRSYETQEFAVMILEKCICNGLVSYIKSSPQYQLVQESDKISQIDPNSSDLRINAVSSLPLWATLCTQILEEVASNKADFPTHHSKQTLRKVRNIVGKVKSLIRCAIGADMLLIRCKEVKMIRVSTTYLSEKVNSLISYFHFLIQKLVPLKAGGTTVWFTEEIFKSIILAVRYLFLLPEVHSSVKNIEVALSIAVMPWIEKYGNTNLEADFQQVPHLFPEIISEDMKLISLHALANISCVKAEFWKSSIFGGIFKTLNDVSQEQYVVASIQALPALLLDPTQQQSDLLHNFLLPTLESNSDAILTALSDVFSSIVCVLSGDVAAVISMKQQDNILRNYVCLTCHKGFPGLSVGARSVLITFKDTLDNFMALLSCKVVAVRRNMAASLGSLVLHLSSMYKSETVQTLMKYAEDDDQQVRLIFSGMVKFLIFSRDWMEGKGIESEHLREEHIPLTQVDRVELSHSRPRLTYVLQLLHTSLLSRLSKNNGNDLGVQRTLLATIVDIGCVPLDCVLLPVLKIVLACVSHPAFSQTSLGQIYLKRIAIAHNTNVANLYHRFQFALCQVLVPMMGMNFHARPLWTKFMDKVVSGLEFESLSAWLRKSLHCVLPTLVVYVVKFKDNAFLTEIIQLLSCSAAAVIKENFQYVYPYAFLNESDEIFDECVKLMEDISKTSAQHLIISSFKTIHNELLLNYHCQKDRVEEGICQLIDVLEKRAKRPQKLQHSPKLADIAKHLEQRFLGILVDFDNLLESSSAEESNKIKALKSLPKIIRLMGSKYITPVRFKVLSLLRTSLRLTHCDFPHLSCGAWEAFIQSVDIKELGPLLGTVAASLLPLLDQFPDEVSSMLEWLVLKFEYELAEHICDLFFLPNIPPLDNVYKVVQRYVMKKRCILNESHKLIDYLPQPLRFIKHDNVDLRRHGLECLLSLLKEKQAEFTQSLLHEEEFHADIGKLLSLLIEGCRDTDEDIRLLCVENLGMLGALDPSHLPHKKPKTALTQIVSVDESRFAVEALTVLAKAYQAARNSRYLDSFAVAIQDLLRHYKISSVPSHSPNNLWSCFPVSIQQVMAPLENSSYFMTTLQSSLVWPHPLFGTRYASTLTNWAHTWACRIVKFIEDSNAKDKFTVCIPSLKRDINCVLFFLPFILLYAVTSGQEDHHKMIQEEMTFIIQQHSLKEESEETANTSISEKFQMNWDKSSRILPVLDSDNATHVLCAKTVFNLLDFLEKWVGWSKKKKKESGENIVYEQVESVQKFLNEFSKLDLAHGNYEVNEYARALMYLECYLMESKEHIKNEEHLSFLEHTYAQLNEPDGIKGVLAIQCSQPKLLEAVVYHEVAGQHQEALACYELLAKQHSNDALGVRIQKGMIRSCLNLDQPYAALHIAEGALSKRPECQSAFFEAQAECFWRINDFESLEGVLEEPQLKVSDAWGVSIGKCLMDIRHGDKLSLKEHLRSTRSYISKVLSTASLENGSYLQGYPLVIKLHMLQELEEGSKVIDVIQSPDISEQCCIDTVQNLVQVWKNRLALVEATSSVQESLLRLRRCLLQLASSFVKENQYNLLALLDQELGTSWLKSAEVARIAECYHQSYIYLLNAEKFKPKRHFIELATLHWSKKEQDHALATLRRGIDQHFPNSKEFKSMPADAMVEDRKICAEAKLLIALYNDESMNVDIQLNLKNYKDAVEAYPHLEKTHASLARYYDRVSLNDVCDANEAGRSQFYAIHSYIKSLMYGCSLIHHSMSRMLTIWLDYGKKYHSALSQEDASKKKGMNTILVKMNECISNYVSMLPAFMFMTGFSQLVSRMCHPAADVYKVIKNIIVRLLITYPQQTMWILVSMKQSSYAFKKLRCEGILQDSLVKMNKTISCLTKNFEKLGQSLAELCQKPVPKELKKTHVSSITRGLPKLLSSPDFSEIMVPSLHCRSLTLPQPEQSSLSCHLPFPVQVPHLVGIKEEVEILSSLQKPRKVTFLGSDGNCYVMMCKNKDDLRLDARVMEFNSIVNKYLQKDPASRSRNLNIRTYSVVPINEECGLIEWVPNLSTYRLIVTQLLNEIGFENSNKEMRKYLLDKDANIQEKRDNFLKRLLPLFPSVFWNWFRNNFTDSRSWFEARKSYVHTLAVMSMVGYILGLGDRHGENILLDNTCGDVVHVDFNCLFNKGERFECPERVPFRLTHNMVSALGPTGVEGPFRLACEITLQVLREMSETLLSVVQPFVYDPRLDEPPHLRKYQPKKKEDEVMNDMAVENVKNISHRLNGMMKQKQPVVQLSVEGQTQVLIQEATSIDNLCQMYVGWGAYY